MPKAITKSKNNKPHKPKSFFDIALNIFITTGHFTLTNEILTIELLTYFREYLKWQPKPSSALDYKFYLDNVTFNIEAPALYSQKDARDYADEKVEYQLQEIFSFSPKWSVIALDNVSILQGDNYYPLSSSFIWRFINQIAVKKDDKTEFIVTNALIITKAELHTWAWMKAFTSPLRLDSLTLELLPHEDNEDNFLVLCEALEYAKINILNLGNTEISVKGYHALNVLLDKNFWIEKMLVKEPVHPASRAIFKKNKDRLLYLDHEKYPGGRWPLCKLDITQLAHDGTRTVGHWLLENALAQNDIFMVKCLIKAGTNLLEQRGDEKPFLVQIFEKNKDFKILILDHILFDKALVCTIERVLQQYSKSKEIMVSMGYFLKHYAETLKKRACPYLLSDYERLLTLLKDVLRLSRPSKQRDQEFIETYWRLVKCLVFFHDALGRVTVGSISNMQTTLDEIIAISRDADWGWNNGSKLHCGLRNRLGPLGENMKEIKKLVEKDDMIYEQDVVIQQKDKTIKNLSEKCEHLEVMVQQVREKSEAERQQFKATIFALETQLKAGKNAETSELDNPGPSTRFFPRR